MRDRKSEDGVKTALTAQPTLGLISGSGLWLGLGPLQFPLVKHTGYVLTIGGLGSCNIVRVKVKTDDGEYEYDFDV